MRDRVGSFDLRLAQRPLRLRFNVMDSKEMPGIYQAVVFPGLLPLEPPRARREMVGRRPTRSLASG